MILVVTSDEVIGECIIRALKKQGLNGQMSSNVYSAIDFISAEGVPDLIYLDILLTGPDGFTLLNELASYADTMNVPVVLMGEKDFSGFDFSAYNVKGFLNKNTMMPEEILKYAK